MPRMVKEDDYLRRRNEILECAQRMAYTKGFDKMSIQDILDELGISKGAFYHYFDSKSSLLEAMVVHLQEQILQVYAPMIDEPDTPALVKLERFFSATARWKSANKQYLMPILRTWYHDDNAVIRQRLVDQGFAAIMPLIGKVIRQGIEEGALRTAYTPEIESVLVALFLGMGDAIAKEMLAIPEGAPFEAREKAFTRMENLVKVFTASIERVLGAEPGAMMLFDVVILREWILPELAGVS